MEKRAIIATADATSYPAILGFAASGPLLPSFLHQLGIAGGFLLTTVVGVGIFSRSSRAGRMRT